MKRTAYLHPLAAEELSLLPPDARPRFYAQILSRLEPGAKEPEVEYLYPTHEEIENRLFTTFHTITSAPGIIGCFDTRTVKDGFIYLHFTQSTDDYHLLSITRDRNNELSSGHAKPIHFDDFFDSVDEEELRIARSIVTAEAVRRGNRFLLKQNTLDARAKTASVFNMANKQMHTFENRIDFYLEKLNELLQPYGAIVNFTASFSSGEVIHFKSLKDPV